MGTYAYPISGHLPVDAIHSGWRARSGRSEHQKNGKAGSVSAASLIGNMQQPDANKAWSGTLQVSMAVRSAGSMAANGEGRTTRAKALT
jgi:hypothetical protein